MSLSLIQSYSSAEEEDEEEKLRASFSDEDKDGDHSDDDKDEEESARIRSNIAKPSSDDSLLPSALDAFSEVAGPPQFLNNCVAEHVLAEDDDLDQRVRHGGGRRRRRGDNNKDLPTGVVVEAKAQLVGIRDRVRNDIDGKYPPASSVPSQTDSTRKTVEGKRVVSATIPDAKDAADLLRMCLQCGIPKTYSNTRGMHCPVCGDRPPVDPDKDSEKKKGSTIKDKEKNKRMKGQSSHSSWKSETEMQLRQQFD